MRGEAYNILGTEDNETYELGLQEPDDHLRQEFLETELEFPPMFHNYDNCPSIQVDGRNCLMPECGGDGTGNIDHSRRRGLSYVLGVVALVGCLAVVARSTFVRTDAGCNCEAADSHKVILQRLGVVGYEEEADSVEELAIDLELPKSQCKDNSYFIDWGSSGAKVYLVHAGDAPSGKLLPTKMVKRKTLHSFSPDADKLDFLDALHSRVSSDSADNSIAIATAGFRVHPTDANKTWQLLRKWNEDGRLFHECDSSSQKGCQTLPGSEEARYELESMVIHAQKYSEAEKKFFGSTKQFALASCGGASIQFGISGASVADMRKCHEDLGHIDAHYDAKRIQAIEDQNLFLISLLADTKAAEKNGQQNDYQVGGVDEMRARYDAWLEAKGSPHNPCIPKNANKYFATHDWCSTHSDHKTCLSDRFGSYITSLPAAEDSTYSLCRASVSEFVHNDVLLSRWTKSSACLDIAAKTKKWGFVSAFGRAGQLGHDVTKPSKWADVKKCIMAKDEDLIHEAEEDMKAGFFGQVITSTMLVTILNELGLDADADVMTSEAEVADSIMHDNGLKPGWIDKC